VNTISALADLVGKPHANAVPAAEPKTIRFTLAEGLDFC